MLFGDPVNSWPRRWRNAAACGVVFKEQAFGLECALKAFGAKFDCDAVPHQLQEREGETIMATRKSATPSAAKPATSLRGKIAHKLEELADAAKAQVVKTEARVEKAVGKAEKQIKAEVHSVAQKAERKLADVKKAARKEVAVVKKAVKAKAIEVNNAAAKRLDPAAKPAAAKKAVAKKAVATKPVAKKAAPAKKRAPAKKAA
jgi:hypothetical protein